MFYRTFKNIFSLTECFRSLFKLHGDIINEIQVFKESENRENETMFTDAFRFVIFKTKFIMKKIEVETF